MDFPKRNVRALVALLPQTRALVERIKGSRIVVDDQRRARAVDADRVEIEVDGFWLKRIWTTHACSAVRYLAGLPSDNGITAHVARSTMLGLQDAIGEDTLLRLRAEEALGHAGVFVRAVARAGAAEQEAMAFFHEQFRLATIQDVLEQ